MCSLTMKSVSLCILFVVVAVTVSSASVAGPIALSTAQSAATAGLPPSANKVDSFNRVRREALEINADEINRRVARESSEEEDEACRPTKEDHEAKCCDLPLVFRGTPELFKACKEELGLPDHKPPPPPPSSEGRGPHGHPRRGVCVAECLFNRTGLLENGKINKEALQKALDEYLKSDGAWKNVATSTLETCFDAQTKGDFKPDNEKFTSGSSEFLRCFSRNLFMDCIPEKWTDSEECKKMKEKLDKCPRMVPPALFSKRAH